MTVLIADDEQKNLILLGDFLTGLGHEVMAAENGKIALEQARANPPEIIISDILMPVMDGFKLCQEWNKDSKLKNIPFIFYTATYTSEDDEKFSLSLGADAFIVKPTPMKELIKIVDEVIKNRKEGKQAAPKRPEITDETAILKEHFARMSRKLEDKLAQLEQTKQVIYESEQMFRAITDNAMDAIILIDNEGCISYWNPAAEKIFGYTREEAIGKQLHQLLIPPRYHDSFKKGFISFKETGKGAVAGKSIELQAIGKGRTEFPIELSLSAIQLKGKWSGLGVVRDVSERKRTEAELYKLSLAVEQSQVSIVVTDAKGNIEYVNPKFMEVTGYTREEVIGKNPRILKSGEHPPEFYKQFWGVLTSGKEWRGELQNKRRDGELYWENASISPIKDTEGVITHFLGVKEDITEKKRLEKHLIQAQKMEAIGNLAGGVAHDFNNLLTVIIGYSDFLLTKLDKQDQTNKFVGEIKKAGQRAASLTHQLLAFSRRQVLQPKVIDLNTVVADIEQMLKRLIGEDIELITDCEPELDPVNADQGQMEQVLMNFVINARDAMAGGGRITVKTENVTIDKSYCKTYSYGRPGRFVCLAVHDTGIGMDKETISHIFEPFFTTKKEGQGTGLGLSVVYGIVKQHEGWINVYSEPGHGSVFRVYLPASRVSKEIEAEEAISLEEIRGHGERVLLVEDEAMLREFAVGVLRENGYAVFAAQNAEEALDIFEREKRDFNLVFSDTVMTGKTGIELVDQLLCLKPELAVLMTSGYLENRSQWSLIQERSFNFVHKPYTLSALLRALRKAIMQG
jgi:PAS domain S-box-containing protein